MNSIDYLIFGLLAGTAVIHVYFGMRYRKYFVVDQKSLGRSYLEMIGEFAKAHPGPGGLLKATIVVQIALGAALAVHRVI